MKSCGGTSIRQSLPPTPLSKPNLGVDHLRSSSFPDRRALLSTCLRKQISTVLLPFSMGGRCGHGIHVVPGWYAGSDGRTMICEQVWALKGERVCTVTGSRRHKPDQPFRPCSHCRRRWPACQLDRPRRAPRSWNTHQTERVDAGNPLSMVKTRNTKIRQASRARTQAS